MIGVPHPDFGETPVALIVPEPGAEPDIEAITAAVRERLARFKHPRAILTIAELPRNTMGKVQKAKLREQYQDMFVTV